MRHTLTIARRVIQQLLHDPRLLGLSVVAPLLIIYFLKIFFDTLPPNLPVARYAVPVAAFIVHFLAFILCSLVLVRERTAGTLERSFINGFRRGEIIGGYVLGYLGLATLQAAIVLTEVLLLFQLRYDNSVLLALFATIWLLAVASILLGIFISTFARNEGQVIPFIPLIILPSIFLSGLLIDADKLPRWAQLLGQLLPLHYANDVIQEVIQPHGAFSNVWGYLLVLVGYCVALLLLASQTLREVE